MSRYFKQEMIADRQLIQGISTNMMQGFANHKLGLKDSHGSVEQCGLSLKNPGVADLQILVGPVWI